MEKLVSAIITTYCRDVRMVMRAAKSVMQQTHRNIEIIVIDDSPEDFYARDEVERAITSLSNQIIYIRHPYNMGACEARNTGLRVATGEFVAFLDDDDEWIPTKIEKQLHAFTSDDVALVYCGQILLNDVTGTSVTPTRKYKSGFVYGELVWENFVGSTSFPLIRRKSLEEIGGFDPLMQSAQDYDVWTRLAQKYKINYVAEPLVIYHLHNGEQITGNPKKRIAGQERFIEKNQEYLLKNKTAWWRRHIRLAAEYGKDRRLGCALKLWFASAIKCPGAIKENLYYLLKIVHNFFSSYRHS